MRRFGESRAHEIQKERIRAILESFGWLAYTEYPFECSTEKGQRTYYCDCFAQNYNECNRMAGGEQKAMGVKQAGARRIICEVVGKRGHNSKAARALDGLRIRDIRASAGASIEYYEFYLKNRKSPNDIRNWADREIAEELGLT